MVVWLDLHELNSVGKDIAYYMKGPEFEPRHPTSLHLNVWALATKLLDQKKV